MSYKNVGRLLGLLLLCGFSSCGNCQRESSPKEMVANRAMKRSVKLLKKKYPLRVVDYSVDLDGSESFQFRFQVKGPLSKGRIRTLLEGVVEDFLAVVNSDIHLCTYLSEYCLSMEQVGITLHLVDSSKADLYSPDIGIAYLDGGDLKFTTRHLYYDEESQEYLTRLCSEVGEVLYY